jgi:hypothetical protein
MFGRLAQRSWRRKLSAQSRAVGGVLEVTVNVQALHELKRVLANVPVRQFKSYVVKWVMGV